MLVERSDRLPPVEIDRHRLADLFANLLSNALRHTPSGGTVTLSAARAEADKVELAVADTGDGIPPELLGRVFERFCREVDRSDRGKKRFHVVERVSALGARSPIR